VTQRFACYTALGLHTGANNGHLCLTLSALSSYGWTSNRKLAAAKNQLLEVGLLVQTRQGGLGIGPSLYALGWLGISRWDGLDISLVQFQKHRGRWKSNGATAAPGAGSGAVPKATNFLHPERVQQNDFLHPERVQQSTRAGTACTRSGYSKAISCTRSGFRNGQKRNRCTRSG
jgi:hypothetical protein